MADRGRLAFLDGLRGWAAVYVILYHTALIPNPGLHVPRWAAPVVLAGGTGVTLFFVVSAFSLCRAAHPGEERGLPLAAFAVRRFFRIAPLFYVVLVASVVRDRSVFGVEHGLATILANLTFVFNLWPGHEEGIAWASWTIGVEVLFYVIFPALAARASTIPKAVAAVLLSLLVGMIYESFLSTIGLQPAQEQYGVLRHLPVFATGILAYRIFQRFIEPTKVPIVTGTVLLLGAAYLYALLLRGTLSGVLFHDTYYWQALIYGALLLGLSIRPLSPLVNNVTLYLGRISYSLYLLHPSIVFALIPFYRSVEAHSWPPTMSFSICAGVTLVAVAALATISYVLVEAPCIRLGRHAAARVDRRLAPGPAATLVL